MQVSGQLHALATYPPPPRALWSTEVSLAPAGIRTPAARPIAIAVSIEVPRLHTLGL
jgi:hypothetical protein